MIRRSLPLATLLLGAVAPFAHGVQTAPVAYPAEDPKLELIFDSEGGTLSSAKLQEPRYTRDAWPPLAGVPEERAAAGPLDLVTTWSPRFRPYRVVFSTLEGAGDATLLVGRGQGARLEGGRLHRPEDPVVAKPLAAGDVVVVGAPAASQGEFPIVRIAESGAIELGGEPADATRVAYRIERRGGVQALFEAGPDFTKLSEGDGLPMTWVWPDPGTDSSSLWIEKRFEAGQHAYELKLTIAVHNFGAEPVREHMGLQISAWQHPDLVQGGMFSFPSEHHAASCFTGESLERTEYMSLVEEPQAFSTETLWAGVDTRYFILAAAADDLPGAQCMAAASPSPPVGNGTISATLLAPSVRLIKAGADACVPGWLRALEGRRTCEEAARALGHELADPLKKIRTTWQTRREDLAGAEKVAFDEAWYALRGRQRSLYAFTLFLGPKESDKLEASGHELVGSLDFGMLAAIAEPMLRLLQWFFGLTGHWAFAILLLTVLVKGLLLPLTNKSFKSMQRMQKLAPEMKRVKEEYKDDREGQGRAMMALYKKEKVNPAAGCLPMFVQMPIWFALYRTILSSVELYHAPLGGWIQDLSSSDPYYVLPVLLGVLMLVQSSFTPSSPGMDPAQQKMMKYGMPLMFSVFMVALPSGLVLYITINTILTILQNLVIKRNI